MFSMFSSPGALNLLNIPFIGAEVFAVVCICENSGRPDPILTLDPPSRNFVPKFNLPSFIYFRNGIMPPLVNSTIRRHRAADRRRRKCRRVTMRACHSCARLGSECVVTPGSARCTACDGNNRSYNLAPPGKEYKKAQDVVEKLNEDILELYKKDLELKVKIARLEKQRKFHLRKLKDIGDREARNILELEADERSKVPAPDLPIFSDFPVDFNWSSVSFPVGEIVAGGPGSSQGS